ncbi:MAG: AMP-binding protein [Succinivibrionaceae bacterium]
MATEFKPWLKSYPNGVSPTVDTNLFNSLLDMYEFSCEKFAEKDAYISMGTRITYKEVDFKARCFAAFLQNQLKMKPGDKIALMMPNVIQYPIVLFGALLAGCTIVNVNPMYTPTELSHQLNDSKAKAIVVISNFAITLQKAMQEAKCLEHVVVTSIGDECGSVKGAVVNFIVKYLKRIVPRYHIEGAISYKSALLIGESFPYTRPLIHRDNIAFLQYTGGTTGAAKGAILTHGNLLANTEQALGMYGQVLHEGKEFMVTAIPLYHVFALSINCLLGFRIGATSLLIADPRNVKAFVKELSLYSPTIITGVNTLFNALINNNEFCNMIFPDLRLVIGGGTSVQKGVELRWFANTGLHILEGYGLTECSPLVAVCPNNITEYTGTIGIPVPSTDVILKDDQGNIITDINVPGELLVKGPQVMKGYYGCDVATQKAFDGEYLRTGDIACWANNEGFIKLVDRKKDMILVSGFNVYPSEIEDAITLHPNVLEVAAIGVPSKHSGECVKVFIVRKNKSLTEDMVKTLCKKHLTAYKVPKYIEFIDKMPKTNVGKVMRKELRKRELEKLGLKE